MAVKRNWSSWRVLSFLFIVGSVLLLNFGCSRLPDIKPFAENTVRMTSGIENGYTQCESLLSLAKLESGKLQEFKDHWKKIRQVLGALVAYSDTLASLAAAGAKGEESGKALADSVNVLLSVFSGFRIPGEAAGIINKQIAAIRAKRSLKEAVTEADPAIFALIGLFKTELEKLEMLNISAGNEIRAHIVSSHQDTINYFHALRKAESSYLQILSLILEYFHGRVEARKDVLQALMEKDPALAGTADKQLEAIAKLLETRQGYWLQQSKYIQSELKRFEADFQEYQNRGKEIDRLVLSGNEIVRKSQAAISSWGLTHKKLKTVLNEKGKIDVAELVVTIKDLYTVFHQGELK